MKDFQIGMVTGPDLVQTVDALSKAVKTQYANLPLEFEQLIIVPEMKQTIAHPRGEYMVTAIMILKSTEDIILETEQKPGDNGMSVVKPTE